MWIPKKIFDLLSFATDARIEFAALRIERDLLKADLASAKANFRWLTLRVNSLEVERAQLLEKAYGIRVPVPEIMQGPPPTMELNAALFDDLGEERSKQLGLPTFN